MSERLSVRERAQQRRQQRMMKGSGGRKDPDTILLPLHWLELAASIDDGELGAEALDTKARVMELQSRGKEIWYIGDPSFYARCDDFGGYRKDALAMQSIRWFIDVDVPEECVQCCEPVVSCPYTIVPVYFEVVEEIA